MFYILWTATDGTNKWELIDGEDAMQVFVSDLVNSGVDEDDILIK